MAHPESIGAYQIVKELARGGQGVVYQAFHPGLKTTVALKVLLDIDYDSVKRFKQEARVLAKIKHPNLLQVYDFGEYLTQGRSYPFMVMEFINGSDLRSIIGHGIPDLPWIIKTFTVIAEALQQIHNLGITHRDLKPANIFLEAETNRPVLIDFGLIKRDPNRMGLGSIDRSRLSQTGEIMGTPAYMSPEQVDSTIFGPVGPWTDVYGLAATLFHILTGETPYKGTSLGICSKLMQADELPPDPRNLNPEIPEYLAEAIMRAMQKKPADRPQDMISFIISLRPPRVVPKRSLLKRIPKRWALAPVVGAGIAAGLWGYHRYPTKHLTQPISPVTTITTPRPSTPPAPITPIISETISKPVIMTLSEMINKIIAAHKAEDYSLAIELCNQAIESFSDRSDIFRVYAMRARANSEIAVGLEAKGESGAYYHRLALADCDKTLEYMPNLPSFKTYRETAELLKRRTLQRLQTGKRSRYKKLARSKRRQRAR